MASCWSMVAGEIWTQVAMAWRKVSMSKCIDAADLVQEIALEP